MKEATNTPRISLFPTLSLGCLLAFYFVSILGPIAFSDFAVAFANQLPLTLTEDAGCLVGIGIAALLRKPVQSSRTLNGYIVPFFAAGMMVGCLLKGGVLASTGTTTLVAGDLLAACSATFLAFLILKTYAAFDEAAVHRHLAVALLIGIAAFLVLSVIPGDIARMIYAIVLPLGIAASLLPLSMQSERAGGIGANAGTKSSADTSAGISVSTNAGTGAEAVTSAPVAEEASSGQATPSHTEIMPRIIVLTVALAAFVIDMPLDLFPISLYYDDSLVRSLTGPAASCIVVLAGFAIMLLAFAKRGRASLTLLYFVGFILVAAGYLTTPYRFSGGVPLGLSESGRLIILVYLLVVFMRLAKRQPSPVEGEIVFLRGFAITVVSMLVADIVVVAIQLQPGFDYADFVFRTIFTSVEVAGLILLVLGPLPLVEQAIAPTISIPATDENASLADADAATAVALTTEVLCERFAQAHGLTARETEILTLIANGRDVPYIEKDLVLAKSTVKTHIRHIYEKCGVSSRQDLLDLLKSFKG